MTDQELRDLVRDSVARHLGREIAAPQPVRVPHAHPSHGLFQILRSGDDDGACLIEPAVRCTHCGFCRSYGH